MSDIWKSCMVYIINWDMLYYTYLKMLILENIKRMLMFAVYILNQYVLKILSN